jgi:hypothetical protein
VLRLGRLDLRRLGFRRLGFGRRLRDFRRDQGSDHFAHDRRFGHVPQQTRLQGVEERDMQRRHDHDRPWMAEVEERIHAGCAPAALRAGRLGPIGRSRSRFSDNDNTADRFRDSNGSRL